MINKGLAAILGLGFLACIWPGSARAQPDKYVEIASMRRRTPVYYEAFSLPGKGDRPVVIVSYKIPHDRLVFMRHHEGTGGESFRAAVDVLVEIYRGEQSVDSRTLKDETFAPDYESTLDPLQGVTGAVTFQLDPGEYGFRLQVTDQSTDRTAPSLVRPVVVPDYSEGKVGKAIIASNVEESTLFRTLELTNLGGDAHFGEATVAVVPFTLEHETGAEPRVRWQLRRLDRNNVEQERKERAERIRDRARKAEGALDLRMESDWMRSTEGGTVVDSGVVASEEIAPLEASVPADVLPDQIRLSESTADPDYFAAIIDLHGERLENGAYVLDIYLQDSDEPDRSTRFDMHWPDMPYSLFDIDVALKNMEFILPDGEQKRLQSGSKEEKIEKFEAFWKDRDPTPKTAYNELMVEYFRRVDHAAIEYRTGAGYIPNGLKTDRAKIYVIHGPPDEITRSFPDRGGVLEKWTYDNGRTFTFEAVSSLDPFELVKNSREHEG